MKSSLCPSLTCRNTIFTCFALSVCKCRTHKTRKTCAADVCSHTNRRSRLVRVELIFHRSDSIHWLRVCDVRFTVHQCFLIFVAVVFVSLHFRAKCAGALQHNSLMPRSKIHKILYSPLSRVPSDCDVRTKTRSSAKMYVTAATDIFLLHFTLIFSLLSIKCLYFCSDLEMRCALPPLWVLLFLYCSQMRTSVA